MKFDWYNKNSQKFMERGYLLEGVTVHQRIDEISSLVGKYFGDAVKNKVKDYIEHGYYVLPTPVWNNVGTNRGAGISCFSSFIEDSCESIIKTVAEVGMLSKMGGGTSAYFGELRPSGSSISTGGITQGPVHFMALFDAMKTTISQGSSRRGEFAAYLNIDHKDINDFLKINQEGNKLQRFPFGVCVPDYWLKEMTEGDKTKRKIWAAVLEARCRTGFPYIFFTDNVNNAKPDVYKDKNIPIYASNMCCVTGDQRVITSKGIFTAYELFKNKEKLKLFDGHNIVDASPMQLIKKNAEVYKITLSNGMTHKITKDHKISIFKNDKQESVKCSDLKIGDKVFVQINKGLFGNENMPDEAFLLGMYHGDGTQYDQNIMIDIWQNDFDLVPIIQKKFNLIHKKYKSGVYNVQHSENVSTIREKAAVFHTCQVRKGSHQKQRLSSRTLSKALNFQKFVIPEWIWKGTEKTQWAYIKGLLYTDGSATINKTCPSNPLSLAISSINKEFLQNIQIILLNLGITSVISLLRKGGKTLLPNGNNGYKYYNTKDCWRLSISSKNSGNLIEKNTKFLSRKKISLDKRKYRDNKKKVFKIINIERMPNEDVYCVNVNTKEHLWVCNGFITHNSEILLSSNNNETFVCDLIGMNLTKYDEWKNTDAAKIAVYIADAVLQDFIDKYKDNSLITRAINFAINQRAIGVGASGYHSYLQSHMIPFESMEAKYKNIEIFSFIQKQTHEASREMAVLYGKPNLLKEDKYDRRHVTLTAVAPNTSSSFIMGQHSQSIEPYTDNYYIKKSAKMKYTVKNPYLEKLLESKGYNNSETWESILKMSGSVQHLTCLDDFEKKVFKTFGEISQMEIVIQAAQRQKYIDQGQSLNLMIHPAAPIKDINTLVLEAHNLGIKTLYYQLNTNAAKEFLRNILTCESCAG